VMEIHLVERTVDRPVTGSWYDSGGMAARCGKTSERSAGTPSPARALHVLRQGDVVVVPATAWRGYDPWPSWGRRMLTVAGQWEAALHLDVEGLWFTVDTSMS